MAEESLVATLQTMFQRMSEDKGLEVDGAALMPAYEGMVNWYGRLQTDSDLA